jgi:hypothetical protein
MVASCIPPLASARAAAVASTIECRVVKVKRSSLVLLEPRPSPFPSLHTGPTLSRIAGEGGECHEPGEGQPPNTPWVST